MVDVLLNFRCIGQQEFLQRISSVTLKNPSVHAPNRRRRLQTFSEKKINKSRVTQLEKDKKNYNHSYEEENAVFATNRATSGTTW